MAEPMFMRSDQGTNNVIWTIVPFFSTVLCILFTMIPLGLSNAFMAPPSFALMAIFTWILVRPSLMPAAAVVVLGLLQDLIWGGPLGLWGVVFLLAYVLTLSQRQFLNGRGFGITWAAFGVVAVVCELLAWIIASLFYWQVMPVLPILSQTILSFAFYPLFGRMAPFFVRHIGAQGS